MRKETLYAIIAGISIGLIIAFSAWKIAQIIKKNKPAATETKKVQPSQSNIGLSVSNLYAFDVITQNPFKILGIAKPNSQIVLSSTESDYLIKSEEDGSFEGEVELPAGLSELKIDGQKIPVVFSSEFEKYLVVETEVDSNTDKTATNEAKTLEETVDVIREKIKDEVSGKSLKKTAFVGTVTDISSGNIQIKSHQGDIKQMAISDETDFINTLKKNVEIKSTDLAIGDYIVAMGLLNGNKVLNAKRILITGGYVENKAETVFGKISTLSKTKLVIDKGQNEVFEITLPKKWIGPNITELEEGQDIIIVVLPQDAKTYTLRTIFTPEI